MDKFTPYEKLSKKNKRELNAKRRQTWSISPVTRKPANPKAYNRQKTRNGSIPPSEAAIYARVKTVSFTFLPRLLTLWRLPKTRLLNFRTTSLLRG